MNTPNLLSPNLRILVVDDNEAIHDDLRKVLCGSSGGDDLLEDEAVLFGESPTPSTGFEVDSAYQGQEALAMVQRSLQEDRPYALAFVDIRMPPGWDGIETVAHLWKASPDLQVVICTAYSDYSWDKMVRRLGHSENLIILKKPFDNIEVIQLAHALTRKWLVTRLAELRMQDLDRMVAQRTVQLQVANEELRHSEERFARAFSACPIALAIQELPEGRFIDVNDRLLEITGFGRGEVIGKTATELRLFPDQSGAAAVGQRMHEQAVGVCRKTGEIREGIVSAELLQFGRTSQRLLILQDTTERGRLEKRLRQAERIETVGQLAAGIAHHFNNLHAAIQGNLWLCEAEISDSKAARHLKEIGLASQRAATLTQELLAFSRRQMLRMQSVDLNSLLLRLSPELERLLGSWNRLSLELAPDLPFVHADSDSLECVLKHLCTNARDAMPAGGLWTLRTEVASGASQPSDAGAGSGPFVCLHATDTGVGMGPVVVEHLFEPFFTTKEVGKGSGLGLASVYGIAKQHRGWVEVSSQPSQGSSFRIFLPSPVS